MYVIIEDDYLVRVYSYGSGLIGKPKFSKEIEQGFIKRVIQLEQ